MNKEGVVDLELFEEDPSGTPSIEVQNLRKVFSSLSGNYVFWVLLNDIRTNNAMFQGYEK